MPHKFIHGDVDDPSDISLQCYACGVVLDCPESYEDTALNWLPSCPGPIYERAHHFIFIGVKNMMFMCAYEDVRVTETSINNTVGPCIGG